MVSRPADEGHRSIRRAVCDGLARGVDAGLADALAEGLRRHLPGGIAILVKGVPLCMLCAFIQFVLGVALPATAIAALLAAIGIGGIPSVRRILQPRHSASLPDKPPVGHTTA